MHLQYLKYNEAVILHILNGLSMTLQTVAMNVCVLAFSPLMRIWLHSWINGTDRKRDQVAHSPSVQMSSSTSCTVDALLIRWEDRYRSPFLRCRLSFKEYKREKRANASFIGNWWASMRQSLVWQHALLWGINPVAAGVTHKEEMITHEMHLKLSWDFVLSSMFLPLL